MIILARRSCSSIGARAVRGLRPCLPGPRGPWACDVASFGQGWPFRPCQTGLARPKGGRGDAFSSRNLSHLTLFGAGVESIQNPRLVVGGELASRGSIGSSLGVWVTMDAAPAPGELKGLPPLCPTGESGVCQESICVCSVRMVLSFFALGLYDN